MEGDKNKDLLKELAEYRSGLQNLLASEAVKAGAHGAGAHVF